MFNYYTLLEKIIENVASDSDIATFMTTNYPDETLGFYLGANHAVEPSFPMVLMDFLDKVELGFQTDSVEPSFIILCGLNNIESVTENNVVKQVSLEKINDLMRIVFVNVETYIENQGYNISKAEYEIIQFSGSEVIGSISFSLFDQKTTNSASFEDID
jgi:hypothetical protein